MGAVRRWAVGLNTRSGALRWYNHAAGCFVACSGRQAKGTGSSCLVRWGSLGCFCCVLLVGGVAVSVETLTSFFGWCAVFNIGLLLFSTVALLVGRKSITRLHAAMFGLEESTLALAYFQYLARYKVVTLALNVVPYIVLKLIASTAV